MSKKEFYGGVSIVARISFCIEAETIEDAKQKLFEANCPMNLVDDAGHPICEITDQSWHMIDAPMQGNVQESDLSEFIIEAENENGEDEILIE